ncbi:MAG: hypothetical protein IH991_01325 [Planctomycetes bacterium]|nr:hypothetical protein [Planctomycetota bacterium]
MRFNSNLQEQVDKSYRSDQESFCHAASETVLLVIVIVAFQCAAAGQPTIDLQCTEFYEAWHRPPQPPITPYTAPFGGRGRAFVGKSHRLNL